MQRSWNWWAPEVSSFLSALASVDGLGVGVAKKQLGLMVPRGLELHQPSNAGWCLPLGWFRAGKPLFLKSSCRGPASVKEWNINVAEKRGIYLRFFGVAQRDGITFQLFYRPRDHTLSF